MSAPNNTHAVWTRFMDMHSGGDQKLDWGYIFIQAPESEAVAIFESRFGRDPHNVTCDCCGGDYSISEHVDLSQATGYERGCYYGYLDADGVEKTDEDWYALPVDQRHTLAGKYFERAATRFASQSYKTLEEYMASGVAHFIHARDIESGGAA